MFSFTRFSYLFILLVVGIVLLVASPALARVVIDSQGQVNVTSGYVLSSESDSEEEDDSGSSGSNEEDEDKSGESEKKAEEEREEAAKKEAERVRKQNKESETKSKAGVKTKLKKEDDGRIKTEIRLQDGTKIKTETRSDRTRTDVYSGASKIRIEREGDRFRIKGENDLGQEIELEEREVEEIDEDANEAELKGVLIALGDIFQLTTNGVTYTLVPAEGLALDSLVGQIIEVEGTPTTESPTTLTITKATLEDTDETEDEIVVEERADLLRIRAMQSKAIIERLNVQALTDLPLSVDLATNILTVTTPVGEKQVIVLPDQAVQNMLAANVIDRLGGEALVEELRQGNIQTLGQVIALGLSNNLPVYRVQGLKEHRFLGFFPVTTDVTVTVSAETGEVVDTDQSLGDTIVDFFSIST